MKTSTLNSKAGTSASPWFCGADFPAALRRGACMIALLPVLATAQSSDPFGTLAAVPPLTGVRSTGPAPCQPTETGQPLNLIDVVDLALCNNARAQAAQVGVAQAAYLPSVSASVTASRNRSEATRNNDPFSQQTAGLNLSYVLYDFGARAANLENARQLFAAAAASRDAAVQSIFLAAMQAFFLRHTADAVLEASRQSEKTSLESFNAAEARYRVGAATPADRLQARTAHAQAVLNRITAEGAVKTAQGLLANTIGADPTRSPTLSPMPPAAPESGFEADVAQLIETARLRRPDLAAAEAQFRAAQAGIESAQASHLPTLSLGVNTARSHLSGQPSIDSSNIGLTLSIPIFSGFSTTYKVLTAEAQADVQAARRDQVRLQVGLDVWNAYAALTTATQSVKSADELLESATLSERMAAGRYQAGVGSILDLLTAQTALANARLSRIQAGFNWYTARAGLAQAMGALDSNLLDELSVKNRP